MSEYKSLYVSSVRCLYDLCQVSVKLAQETDKCEIYMFTERLKKELDDSEWPQNLSLIFDTDDFNLICTILIAGVGTYFTFCLYDLV